MADEQATDALLFDPDEFAYWRELWKDMPEFVCEDLEPLQTIQVHFATRGDAARFAELVGQKIGPRTPSIWYPESPHESRIDWRYVVEP